MDGDVERCCTAKKRPVWIKGTAPARSLVDCQDIDDSRASAGLATLRSLGEVMHVDWVAVATGAAGIAAIIAAVVTIRSTAAQNRRQQLAGMATTAIGYFRGGSQERSAGIAALEMVETGLAGLKTNEQELYRAGIRALLYGQLLYVYSSGRNRFDVHETYNLEVMSNWLCSKEIIRGLSRERIEFIIGVMRDYAGDAISHRNDPAVKSLVNKLPVWIRALEKQKRSLPIP